jgi:hypothetical protein
LKEGHFLDSLSIHRRMHKKEKRNGNIPIHP